MIKNIQEQTVSKRKTIELIKEKLRKEKDLTLRNITSEKSFELAEWSKYLAHQLGYFAALEELDKYIPDPETLND
jgi:hypothetical protein